MKKLLIWTSILLFSIFALPASAHASDYASDRAEIEDLMARYLFALDWGDFDSLGEVFTEDAVFEYARGTARGRDEIRDTLRSFTAMIGARYADAEGRPPVLRHVLAQTAIRVEGDRAWARAFWWEIANDGPAGEPKVRTFGIYEDELRRVDRVWLISKRNVLNDFLPGREPGKVNPVREMYASQ